MIKISISVFFHCFRKAIRTEVVSTVVLKATPGKEKITQMSLCVGNRAWENKLVLQDAGVVLESERSIFMRMRRVGWICPL